MSLKVGWEGGKGTANEKKKKAGRRKKCWAYGLQGTFLKPGQASIQEAAGPIARLALLFGVLS